MPDYAPNDPEGRLAGPGKQERSRTFLIIAVVILTLGAIWLIASLLQGAREAEDPDERDRLEEPQAGQQSFDPGAEALYPATEQYHILHHIHHGG